MNKVVFNAKDQLYWNFISLLMTIKTKTAIIWSYYLIQVKDYGKKIELFRDIKF